MDISIKEVLTHLHRISGTGQAEPWGGQIGPIKRPPLMNAVQNALCEASLCYGRVELALL